MRVVLVTGGSGFIASYCILQLLAAGHRVRTTVRDLRREAEVRAMLAQGGAEPDDRPSFFAAELTRDAGWREAVAGCDYVLHVASPISEHVPKNADDMIVPARDGTLRVLRAARDAGVKRVVLTSSFTAIGYGHKPQRAPFDENTWTDPRGGDVLPYARSKTLAERAAWDFVAKEGGGLELSVVCPVLVLGPLLTADFSPSIALVQRLLEGAIPGCPRLYVGIVDVRDVADLHVRAMTDRAAKGERFLAVAGDFMSVRDISAVLKARLGPAARRVPSRELPNWLLRMVGLVHPQVRQILPELGKVKNATGDKARRLLGWAPRPREDAIAATGESLLRLGLLKDGPDKAAMTMRSSRAN
jgi:nucleoside-diphosphate-sugar epimerase